MSAQRTISSQDFLSADALEPEACLQGRELLRAFWAVRGQKRELQRREQFWAATNDNLASAYRALEERSAELKQAREALVELNRSLEQRVAAQVEEIVQRAREVEALNLQLQHKVRERSRELATALRRLEDSRAQRRPLSPGDLFAERVRIHRLLGQGGMGSVYLGDDLLTSRPVAIKLIHASLANHSDGLHRFFGEAEAAAAISHPGVVKTLHVDVTVEGQAYQIMEFVDGLDLATRARQAALPIPACLRLAATLTSALAAAHAAGVVHRDLKPSNILLTRDRPGVRILDFGISKLLDGVDGAGSQTRTAQLMGTPAYMSPEQIRDASSVGGATDVYSFGVVLYEVLTGRLPFDSDSVGALCAAHLYEVPPPVQTLLPVVPDELAAVVMRCLAKQPEARPKAAELAAQLTAWADAQGAPSAETLLDLPVPQLGSLQTLAG